MQSERIEISSFRKSRWPVTPTTNTGAAPKSRSGRRGFGAGCIAFEIILPARNHNLVIARGRKEELLWLPLRNESPILGNMNYKPQPIETDSIVLPAELAALTERLAENAHDLWAAQRAAQGWTYGTQRDDAKKLHPCLIPYDQLPESEKEYDRQAAVGTLKAILKLGYKIIAP